MVPIWLSALARFGTLALFEGHLLYKLCLVCFNSSLLVAILYVGPMRSLWLFSEGMDVLPHFITGANGSDLAVCLGQVWHFGPLRRTFTPQVMFGVLQFFSACCNIVCGTHEEP